MSSTEAGTSIVVVSRSPTQPDGWSQADRDAAAAEARRVYKSYMSKEYAEAVDAIHNFKSACEAEKVDYADAFLSGDMTAEEYMKVDDARKHLNAFWKEVRELYKACKLTAGGGDFFSPDKRWLRSGNEYRVLVEPLDIANWYKASIHLKGSSGHYIDHVKESEEKTKRPSQYAFLDRLMRDAGGEHVYSLRKAEEYERKARTGKLQIHKLEDARAAPPRGFQRISPLVISVPTEAETEKAAAGGSNKVDPTESGTPVSILRNDLTPPLTPVPDFEKLSLAPKVKEEVFVSTPPGWRTGVRYRIISDRFKVPRRSLPEPKYGPNNERMIPAGTTWNAETKAAEIEVDYNAIVYKTENKKYLVVRAKIFTNVQLAHDDKRHCGYFQESLTFSMHAPGNVEVSPGTLPLPQSDEKISFKTTEKKGKSSTVGGTASVQVNAAGPTATLGVNAGRTWTSENTREATYKSEPVEMAFETDEGKLAWTWKVKYMEDGVSSYATRALNGTHLGGLSTFARTSSLLKVQGTWSFPKDQSGTVTLRTSVGQTLCYDAALQRTIVKVVGFNLKTCVNSPDESGMKDVEIPLELPEESLKVNDQGASLPEPEH